MQRYEAHGNVLVVEDDSDCGGLLVEILQNAGFGVRLVRSRDAAVAAFEHNLYDHIVLDISMRGMPIHKFIREHVGATEKIILISAVVDPEAAAHRLGVEHWIRKPFDPDTLVDMLLSLSPHPA